MRRATKILPHLKDLPYKDRLKSLNLFSLTYRRRRGDLIQMFRIIKEIDNINSTNLTLIDPNSITRGHTYKLKKKTVSLNCRKFHFTQRVLDDWNRLHPQIVLSENVSTFKKELDNWLRASKYDA